MRYLVAFCIFLLMPSAGHAQNLGGIGAQLLLDTAGGYTMPRILALVPGTPADSVLKATDYIYKVNDISCKNKTIEDVVAMIRGEVGTTLKIVVTDTKEGKKPRTYTLTRKSVQGVTNQPPKDPEVIFNEWMDQQVLLLQGAKHTIIKTFSATSGNRYFNFEADPRTYHVMVITQAQAAGAAYTTAVRLFDNEDEASAVTFTKTETKSSGPLSLTQTEGEVTFKKNGIGVVNVRVSGDEAKCLGMHVIVYR